jgi:hypothetical protein
MPYFRRPKDHEHPYAQISNAVLEDERLSFKAKGLLAYLLSRCDEWKIYQSQLASIGPDGESAVRSGIEELIDVGFLKRKKRRADDGTFAGWTYIVYEQPTGAKNTETGFSDVGSSEVGESQSTNTDEQQNENTSPRAREDDPPGVKVWTDVTGQRPSIGTRQQLKEEFTRDGGPRWDKVAFQETLREAKQNVGGDADRIRVGYLMSSYKKRLARSGDGAPTHDSSKSGKELARSCR